MTPRPAYLVPCAFWAGLATGLLRFYAPAGAVLGWCVIAGALAGSWLVRAPRLRLAATVAALGLALGLVAWRREARSCAATLPTGRMRLAVRLAEPVDGSGGPVEVVPGAAGGGWCDGPVAARWPPREPAGAGTVATVEARWAPRPDGLGRADGMLFVSRVLERRDAARPGERLRNATVAAMTRLYGTRAPLVEMLMLDRRGRVDRALRDRFADSGLVHILSISGFHVGLIAAWVALVARLAGQGPVRSLAVATAVAVGYVAFLGWPPPATRAAVLATLLLLGRVRQRRVAPDPLLLQSCLVVTFVDPWALVDLGAWLSAASLWGATTATRWSDRAWGPQAWRRVLTGSIGATAATAPLTAATLGTVAVVGIGLNFAAIPVAAVAVPGVAASLLLAPVSSTAAGAMAAGAGLGLDLLERLAAVGAAVPGGHIAAEPGLAVALPWAALLGALLWGIRGRATGREALRRWGWVATAALWGGLAFRPTGARDAGPGTLALHFLDVGQGDAAALRTPGGHWIVVDAGPRDPRNPRRDAGRQVVVPFLRRQGVRAVDVLVVSHAHADHLGGADALLERLPVRLVTEPGELVSDPLYREFLDDVAGAGVRWHPGRPGERFEVDGVRFSVLHPDTAWTEWGDDLNEDSLVLLVEYGRFRALFAGDAGFPAESLLAGRVGRVALLKVGHHGSAGSSSDRWLAELGPRVGVVSVGARNRYGHPAPSALARLRGHGVSVWRTDRDGTISVMVTHAGDSMTVRGAASTEAGARGLERYSTTP
ncbi:MAG TPA: DNA internalization-related competence protein ComEC/Rec2 [Gemmatimonadales bacterium]|nr:DNA internalization-related competence protein ComEC/Rec2 [Gemmatimonadales bacterium]